MKGSLLSLSDCELLTSEIETVIAENLDCTCSSQGFQLKLLAQSPKQYFVINGQSDNARVFILYDFKKFEYGK
ncbi:hypothetical protein AKJ16_DCAP11569 [Drosera capensis]